ncbi:MAG TPA: glycosyltransferase family 4 protein [Acidimicrobiia bacterium]
MKIALVCPYDLGRPGGVQQQVVELCRRLTEAGHEAWAVAPGVGPGWHSAGRPVVISGNASRVPLALSPAAISRVRKAVAGADVVHVHEPLMPMTSLAALLSAGSVVATFHAAPPNWVRALYRGAAPLLRGRMRGAQLTAVSAVAAAAVPGSWGPVTVVPNGLDTEAYRFEGVARVGRRVAFLGRDEPRKGLDVLLEAWPAVRRAVADAELVVMGASRPLSLPGVVFRGRVDDGAKQEALAECGIFAAPNLGGESFGIVVAEGMAAGCAVVASDLDAFRAVAGEAAEYVPGNDPVALADRIIRLMTDERSRDDLGAAARVRARRFDWSVVVEGYLDVYRRLRSV